MITIRHVTGPLAGQCQSFDSSVGLIVFGRSTECQVVYPPSSTSIGRKHFALQQVGDGIFVARVSRHHLVNINGTRAVDGQLVQSGSAIQLGATDGPTFSLDVEDRSTERAPEPTMEEIFASIRRIITDDEAGQSPARSSGGEAPASEEEEILDLAGELGGLEIVEDDEEPVLEVFEEVTEVVEVLDLEDAEPDVPAFLEAAPEPTAAEEPMFEAEEPEPAQEMAPPPPPPEMAAPEEPMPPEPPRASEPAPAEPKLSASEEAASALERAIAALRADEAPQPEAMTAPEQPEEPPFWPAQASEERVEPAFEPEPAPWPGRIFESDPATAREPPFWSEPIFKPEPTLSPVVAHAKRVARAHDAVGLSGTLEDSVKDMLRPMLREWLDENMPGLAGAGLKALPQRDVASGPAVPNDEVTMATEQKADIVDVSVYGPISLIQEGDGIIQVFLHQLGQSEIAQALSKETDPTAARRGTQTLAAEIARGKQVQIILDADGLTVRQNVHSLIWRGEPCSCQFHVAAPMGLTRRCHLQVLVLVDSIPLGSISFTLDLEREQTKQPVGRLRGDRARHYRYAFLSYASPDRAEVIKRAQGLRAGGIEFFADLLSLEPGQRWEQRLYQEIDQCDVFLLFWSSQAKSSEWVMREAQYAIARRAASGERSPDIVPVVIEGPPAPEPPDVLKSIHFSDSFLYVLAGIDAEKSPLP